MHSYTVTIGRNVPVTDPTLPQRDDVTGQRIQVPMSDEQWATFVEDVKADMASTYADLYLDRAERTFEVHYGKGVWEGVEEESAKITLLAEFELDERGLSTLRNYLTDLAGEYGQDAIALTIGTSELC